MRSLLRSGDIFGLFRRQGPNDPSRIRDAKILLFSLIAVSIVFVLDLFAPMGYNYWVFYVFPLLIIYRAERISHTFFILALIAVAMAFGGIHGPVTYRRALMVSALNRFTALIVLTIFTFIINSLIQTRKRYQLLSQNLAYANKELESFSYSAAHDLRGPLIAIKGFSGILLEGHANGLDQLGQDYLRRIAASSDKLSSLIDDMLSLSKISLQEITVQDIDMSVIADSIIGELRRAAPDRVAEIRIQPDLKALADSHLMKIALSNLLGNAWKFTSKKEAARIEFGVTEKNGRMVYFVRDNGAGFDMTQAERLFEPFKRLHSEREFSGTGIGLSIVDRVIRRHGGRTWGESESGKGATFYFTLPR